MEHFTARIPEIQECRFPVGESNGLSAYGRAGPYMAGPKSGQLELWPSIELSAASAPKSNQIVCSRIFVSVVLPVLLVFLVCLVLLVSRLPLVSLELPV